MNRLFWRRIGCTILAPALLSACAVNQQQEVATYRQVIDADAPPRIPSIERLAPDEPLTLPRALALANQDNERLGLAGENYLQALIAKRRILADFLPTITLAPNYSARDSAPGDTPHAARNFNLPFTAAYNNFNGMIDLANLASVGATIEQQKSLLLDAKASLLIDVATAYYTVLRSERLVVVLGNSLAVQEERVRDAEAQAQAGTARPLDVAQAQAQAAATRVLLIQARGDVRNGRSVLAFLMGVPAGPGNSGIQGPLVDTFAPPPVTGDSQPLLARAEAHRQDLLAAQAAAQAARSALKAAIAEYYPSLQMNLNYFAYKELEPTSSVFAAFFQANLPLFTAGRIHADVRAAWSQFRQADLATSATRRLVHEQVEVAYQNLRTSNARLVELRVQVAAAQEAFDQARDLVHYGRATYLELLVAQDQLLNAQLQLASEEFNQKVFYLQLQREMGELTLSTTGDVMITQAPAAATTQPATQP